MSLVKTVLFLTLALTAMFTFVTHAEACANDDTDCERTIGYGRSKRQLRSSLGEQPANLLSEVSAWLQARAKRAAIPNTSGKLMPKK